MSFNPKSEYTTVSTNTNIKDFFDFAEDYITRPPYQRKAVWSTEKKQALMDSLFRRYYIPKLVIREVRLSDNKTVSEVVDGQQRITAVQEFFSDKLRLPKSLEDLGEDLPGRTFEELSVEIRKFIQRELKYQVDIIKDIEQPRDPVHQTTATEIFWRLQQGETLNYMEIAHAQLSSLTRNFIVKYADDQTFDYNAYKPVETNPDKLPFFSLLSMSNKRMRHLQLMARFLLIEREMCAGKYADLSNEKVSSFINSKKQDDGVDNLKFGEEPEAVEVLKTLKVFHGIFENDPMWDDKSGIKEFSVEYFTISIYVLIRHLRLYYVIDGDAEKTTIRTFVHDFHHRWKSFDESSDVDMLSFSNRRQQEGSSLEARDIILRHVFFEYLAKNNKTLIAKDTKRAFTELERIKIYRDGKGLCQQCLEEEKPKREAEVSWSEYQADHVIPHSKGGKTVLENAQLLCRYHNQSKGAK